MITAEDAALDAINSAIGTLESAKREMRQGKPALALLDVSRAGEAIARAHWPLMRAAGVKA